MAISNSEDVAVAAAPRSDPSLGAVVAQEMHIDDAAQEAVRYLQKGESKHAETICTAILKAEPDNAGVHHLMAAVLHDKGDYDASRTHVERAVELEPDNPLFLRTKATVLVECGEPVLACETAQRAVALAPNEPTLLTSLADTYFEQADYRKAISAARRSIALDPNHAQGYMILANGLSALARFEECDANFQRCIALRPDSPLDRINRSLALMLAGDLERGLVEYEWRWKWKRFPVRKPPVNAPRWEGEELQNGRILLWSEQGLGDTIQFIRYAKMLRERCGEVVLVNRERTARLLGTASGVDRVLDPNNGGWDPNGYDAWVPTMSLPRIFGTTLDTIPSETPYLSPPKEVHPVIKERLDVEGLKVGFAWTGNAAHRHNRHRSIPAEALKPLAELEGIVPFRLQREVGTTLAYGDGGLVLRDLEPDDGDLADGASAVNGLDLVITVDTSVAHLAGALNKECWILLSFAPDFRWLRDRPDSLWYPSVRLFRQPSPGDWESTVEQVRLALIERVKAGAGKTKAAPKKRAKRKKTGG